MSIRSRLVTILAVIAAVLVVTNVSAWIGLSRQAGGLDTIYADRVVPLRDLKIVSDAYAVLIVDASHKVRNGNWPAADGAASIRQANQKIRDHWNAYVATKLTDREAALVAQADLGSSERPISLKELADLVIAAGGNPNVEIRYAEDFTSTDRHADREIHRRYCSGDKAKRLLGFTPKTSLEDGIHRIMQSQTVFEKWESTELPYLVDEMT
jgi:hypothetical protein